MVKKTVDIKESKELVAMLASIMANRSPATSSIDQKAREFVKALGYDVIHQSGGEKYKWVLGRKEDEKEPVKARRIVSTGRKSISKGKVEEIKKMRLEGHSLRHIAKIVGVSEGTVRNYTKGL